MEQGIFITGTDTGVGKTYVASGIALALTRSGVDVGVMKPAETGCSRRKGRLVPGDACALMKAAGASDPLNLINPYRFRPSLAPALAATLAGTKIDAGVILSAFKKLSRLHDFMIVEGAGGIMVPLGHDYTYLDLVRALQLPVLIVARPGLGTINHTLLTISALQHRSLNIAGVVVNCAQDSRMRLAEKTNPSIIEKMSGIPVLDFITHGSSRFKTLASLLKK